MRCVTTDAVLWCDTVSDVSQNTVVYREQLINVCVLGRTAADRVDYRAERDVRHHDQRAANHEPTFQRHHLGQRQQGRDTWTERSPTEYQLDRVIHTDLVEWLISERGD